MRMTVAAARSNGHIQTPEQSRVTSVLHVLDHSLPQQSGYASRSHALLTAFAAIGLKVDAITSPKHGACAKPYDEVDLIRYWRTPASGATIAAGVMDQLRTVLMTREQVRIFCRNNTVDLIHAHSPCLNGFAAMIQKRPVVYEMRSSWEDASVSSGTTTEGSLRYQMSRALETWVIRRAQAATVICEGLKRELVFRGIPEKKISVVPNALPEEMFDLSRDTQSIAVQNEFGLRNKPVIGYFGSFFEWEGVDALITAMPTIIAAVPDVRLLLIGGGRQEVQLRRLVEELGLSNSVLFVGRVEPEVVRHFYSAADVMVYPRISNRLTEMVTPLKPLEAMAQKVPVIASDVGGHLELIENGVTGFLYPAGDTDALAAKIIEVLGAGPTIHKVTTAARLFVERERRWSVVCQRYIPVYERALGRRIETQTGAVGE